MNKLPEIGTKISHDAWGNGTILGWYDDKYAFVKFPSGTRLINPNKNFKYRSEIIARSKK